MPKAEAIYNMAAFVQVPGRPRTRLGDAVKLWDGLVTVQDGPQPGRHRVFLPDSKGMPHPVEVTELVAEAVRLVLATKRWYAYMKAHPEAAAALR